MTPATSDVERARRALLLLVVPADRMRRAIESLGVPLPGGRRVSRLSEGECAALLAGASGCVPAAREAVDRELARLDSPYVDELRRGWAALCDPDPDTSGSAARDVLDAVGDAWRERVRPALARRRLEHIRRGPAGPRRVPPPTTD